MILHVTRAVHGPRVLRALELAEDLAVGLTRDVRQHVEATPMGHADRDLVEPRLGGSLQQGVEERDRGLSALETEALLTDVLGLEERLESLGLVEFGEHAHLRIMGGFRVRNLHMALDPTALRRVLDMHVFDADRAAIRIPQHPDDLAQERCPASRETAYDEFAVKVPEGEPVARDFEVGMRALLIFERVDICHEMAAYPERIDQFLNPRGLGHTVGQVDVDVGAPLDRLVGNAKRGEDSLVEAVLTDQALVNLLEKFTRPGTLDHAVIVGRSEGDRLTDSQLGQGLRARALKLGGIFKGASTDDRTLAAHQTRNRMLGTDTARIREGDRGAGEVVGKELVTAGLRDDGLVGTDELAEGHLLGLLDTRNQQHTGAVGLGHIDGEAEVDVRRGHYRRLALDLVVEHVLARKLFDRLHDRPPDEVSERDLPTARSLQMVVDHDAVVDHQLRGDGAHARRGGHGEAGIHIRCEILGHALERGDGVLIFDRGRDVLLAAGGSGGIRGNRLRLGLDRCGLCNGLRRIGWNGSCGRRCTGGCRCGGRQGRGRPLFGCRVSFAGCSRFAGHLQRDLWLLNRVYPVGLRLLSRVLRVILRL